MTKLSETYVETIPFTVTYKNLPEKNIINLDTLPSVDVTVSTYGFKLLSYYFYNQDYELDFKKIAKDNDNNYVWLANNGIYDFRQKLGKSVDVISIKPDSLILPFGTLSVKKVPVVLNSSINFASGYDSLKGIEIIPDSVKVIGPLAEVNTIEFVETETLNLEDLKTSVNSSLALDFSKTSENLKLSQDNIKIKAKVEKFTEGTVDIPVTLLNLPNDVVINYFPKQIKVSYYLSLEDYKDVKASDFKIECDYNDVINTEKTFFKPKLIVNSDKVKSANMKQNKIEYIIVK